MARALLNVKTIQAAKPAEKEYLISDGDGLFMRVLPSGKKTWQFIYTQGTRRRKLTLGDAADVSLATARERAAAERARVDTGDDPRVAHLMREAEQAKELAQIEADVEREKAENLPLQSMVTAWLTDGVSRSDGNVALRRSFDIHVLPKLGKKPVRGITETEIRDVLRGVGRTKGKNRTAVLLLADIRQLFRWAEKRKPWRQLLVEGNPAELVEVKQIVQPEYDLANERERVLSADELRALRDALAGIQVAYDSAIDKRIAIRPLGAETRLALWIMLATCCRIGELTCARWEHVNLQTGEWLVPRENTKTKKTEWMVFLSGFALRQFQSLRALTKDSPWCFPARNHDGALDGKSISKQIGDRQFQFKNRKELRNRRNDNTLVLQGGDWTPHDLRRTGSTLMQSLGVSEHVRERCLNHTVGGKLGRVYGRYEFASEKRAAWDLLGKRLEAILQAGTKAQGSKSSADSVSSEPVGVSG
jgi:integrase